MASYKDLNREIKGYVEVKYNVSEETPILSLFYDNGNKTYEIDSAEFTTPLQNIYSTSRKSNKYAILEENYTSLDGSFLLFDKINQDSGFISDKTINEYIEYGDTHGGDNTQICLEIGSQENLIETDINGLTIYAKYNKITSCHATLYDSEFNTIEERNIIDDNSPLLLIFANSLKDKFIYIDHITFEKKDRRIMIDHIDIGMSYVYEDNELIEFSIIEEVDKLVQKTPANELTVTIGDYDKLYDPLNPTGITKYLTENATFIPYIGIANDNGKIEYTKMGTFYYDSIDYQDGQVTITAYNLIKKLSDIMIRNIDNSLESTNMWIAAGKLQERLILFLSTCYPYDYDIEIQNQKVYTTQELKYTSLVTFLQQASMLDGIFFVSRDNKITIKNINKNIIEILTKTELIDNPSYKNVKKYNSFYKEIGKNGLYQATSEINNNNNFNINTILNESKEEICVSSDNPTDLLGIKNSEITYTGATSVKINSSTDVNHFLNMIFLEIIGEIGQKVTITGKARYKIEAITQANTRTLIGNEKETNIVIDNPFWNFNFDDSEINFKNFINKMYSYEVSLNYNGNPNIKAGDYIEVETDYGFIPVFVQKHQLTYDGGLSGSIEGVE